MQEVCVIVPGIGGSILTKKNQTLWDVSHRAFLQAVVSRGQLFQQLTLSEPDADDDVVPKGLIHGVMVIPGFWNYGDYRPFTKILEKLFGGAENVIGFAYDWRRSNAHSASKLKTFIDSLLTVRPPGTRVVLVAHSMGGLVARRYLACESGYEHCSMLVTIGTPYQGAAKALTAIARGVPKIPGVTGAHLHAMLQSLPSVHELLPTYPCIMGPSDNSDNRQTLADRLPDEIESSGLFQAASSFHTTTQQAVAALGAGMPPTLAVVGQQQPTDTLAQVVNGRVIVLPDAGWETPQGLVRGAGDGTVPRISSQPPEWGNDTTRAHPVPGRHINLPSDAAMHRALASALEGRKYLGLGAKEQGGISVAIPDVVAYGEAVVVEAHHPQDDLELDISAISIDDGATRYHSILRRLGNGQYQRSVKDLQPGTYEIRVEGLADGAQQYVSELLTILPAEIV
jgi:pimeloyl-ACP methyl ester carboxylesterase